MFKQLSKIVVLLIGGALLIYSASRTVDFLTMTLPKGQEALAFVALLAFDGALVGWTLAFMFAAHNGAQRAISLLMIVVSLVAVTVGFGADTVINAATNGVIADLGQGFRLAVVLLTTAVIAANIAATTAFHVVDNGNRERMKAEDFDERIRNAADVATKDVVNTLAAELADALAEAKRRELLAQYLPQLNGAPLNITPTSTKKTSVATNTGVVVDEVVQPATSSNGKVHAEELHTLNAEPPVPVEVAIDVEPKKRTGRHKKSG